MQRGFPPKGPGVAMHGRTEEGKFLGGGYITLKRLHCRWEGSLTFLLLNEFIMLPLRIHHGMRPAETPR